jgi:hypothetical protein
MGAGINANFQRIARRAKLLDDCPGIKQILRLVAGLSDFRISCPVVELLPWR